MREKKSEYKNHKKFYWPTNEDWGYKGLFERNTVCVSISSQLNDDSEGFVKMSVYGMDVNCELQMIINVSGKDDTTNALNTFYELSEKLPNPITQQWLIDKNFRYY